MLIIILRYTQIRARLNRKLLLADNCSIPTSGTLEQHFTLGIRIMALKMTLYQGLKKREGPYSPSLVTPSNSNKKTRFKARFFMVVCFNIYLGEEAFSGFIRQL